MLTIECPWCEESALLPLPWTDEPETTFTCADCGTVIDWVEEPVSLELAA